MQDRLIIYALRLGLIALVLLLSACNKGGGGAPGQVNIVGDKLYLPPDCRIERYNKAQGWQPYEFTKFDGDYPEYWPEGFTLPPEFYLLHSPLELQDAKNQESQDRGGRMFDLDGVVSMSFNDTVDSFRRAGRIAGLEPTSDEFHDTLEIAQEVGMRDKRQIKLQLLEWGPGKHRLSFHGEELGVYPVVILDIFSDSDMGDYTYIWGSVAIYLPEGDLYR